MVYPDPISRHLDGYRTSGQNLKTSSQSQVYHYSKADVPDLFLKIDHGNDGIPIAREKNAMDWLCSKLPVPRVVAYHNTETAEYLLTTRISGIPSHDTADKAQTVRLLAEGLRAIHAVCIDNCPLPNYCAAALLTQAEHNVTTGLVTVESLTRRGDTRSPAQALAEVHTLKPVQDELVLTHGDYCLPNIMIDSGCLTGFIDWGYAGIGDRHRDFIAAEYSIRRNLGEPWIAPFLDTYGRDEFDESTMNFYRAIYELA